MVDRTLSRGKETVATFEESDVYHYIVRVEGDEDDEQLIITDCGKTEMSGDIHRVTESDAIDVGLRRCMRCTWTSKLRLYSLGAKEYHAIADTEGAESSECAAIGDAENRQHAKVIPERRLEANGIEPCDNCSMGGGDG